MTPERLLPWLLLLPAVVVVPRYAAGAPMPQGSPVALAAPGHDASDHAKARNPAHRRYALAGHGTLELDVPATWRESIQHPSDGLPPTIVYMPASGQPFRVVLTPLWPMHGKAPAGDPDAIRADVEHSAEAIRGQSVPGSVKLHPIRGAAGSGYYLTGTDPAPGPDGYKYIAEGELRVGGITVVFTILTNDGQDPIVAAGLAAMKSAVQRDDDTG